jgi:hypothetical protein
VFCRFHPLPNISRREIVIVTLAIVIRRIAIAVIVIAIATERRMHATIRYSTVLQYNVASGNKPAEQSHRGENSTKAAHSDSYRGIRGPLSILCVTAMRAVHRLVRSRTVECVKHAIFNALMPMNEKAGTRRNMYFKNAPT